MKIIIICYITFMLQIIIHEGAHYIVAKVYNWQIMNITIGDKDLSIKLGILNFSFYPIGGCVEVKIISDNKDVFKKLLFYSAGNIASILFCIIGYTFLNDSLIKLVLLIITGATVFNNILPKPFKSDLALFLEAIK